MSKEEFESGELLKKWRGQLSRGVLEFLILILLQKERYGWDILQLVRSLLPESKPPVSDGTIYNILTRFKERSLVSTRSETIDGRKRRYYILSDKGKQVLESMQKDWNHLITSISEIEDISKK